LDTWIQRNAEITDAEKGFPRHWLPEQFDNNFNKNYIQIRFESTISTLTVLMK